MCLMTGEGRHHAGPQDTHSNSWSHCHDYKAKLSEAGSGSTVSERDFGDGF